MFFEMLMNGHDKKLAFGMICALYIAAFAVTLIPMYRLALYSVPWYDDYSYGIPLHVLFTVNPDAGLLDILKTVVESVRVEWWAWQGTFSSIFLMSFSPIVFGEEYYFLGALFLISILAATTIFFVYTVCTVVFGCRRVSGIIMGLGTATALINTIHTSQAGFYWYNAGVHYVGMHSIFFLWTAFLIRSVRGEKKFVRYVGTVLGTLLSVAPAGANFVTALQGLGVICAVVCYAVIREKYGSLRLLPAFLIYAFGFYMNVRAPGNSVRARSYVGWGYSPIKAVLLSFKEGILKLWTFTGLVGIVFIVFLASGAVLAVWNTEFKYTRPWLFAAVSYVLYCTGFTPSLYSLGHAGLGRTLNAVKLTFWMLLVLNIIYISGYLFGRNGRMRNTAERFGIKTGVVYAAILFATAAGAYGLSTNRAGTIAGFGAYYYVHSGEAFNFREQYLERVQVLKSEEKDVVFETYRFRPWMLCAGELSDDPEAEENRLVEEWYKKDSVRIRNGEG